MQKKGKDRGKANRNAFREVPCIIGIDQSYTRTGIAICIKGKIKKISSIDFLHVKSKTMKRILVAEKVDKAINACLKKFNADEIVVIVERIRTYTSSNDLRPDFLKTQGALIACIVDTAYKHGIKTFSVDTRAWKSAVLGSSKPIFDPVPGVTDPQKFGSVKKIIDLGFYEDLKTGKSRNGVMNLNDDAADAACISLYGFTGYPYLLLLEQ